jgi:hypothetical protein
MEVLSFVAEQGDRGAEQVLTGVRKSINERLNKGQEREHVIRWGMKNDQVDG